MMVINKNNYLNLVFKSYGWYIYKTLLTKTQYYTCEQIKKYQYNNLKKTLIQASKVPYYAEIYNNLGFDPRLDFKKLSDLSILPILTKEIITERYVDLINPTYKSIAIEYSTSGSTGNPMNMLLTPYMVAIDKAMIFRHHSWATNKMRPTIFSIRSYVRKNEKSPFYRYDRISNNYFFSAYDLTKKNVKFYRDYIVKINPDIIRGYPSSISLLCEFLTSKDIKRLTNLKGIYTSSETLTSDERNRIVNLFGNRLFNWYGMTEPAIIIKEGPNHEGMHLCFEYGYHEFLDSDLKPQIKNLITTSYFNSVMPFIRYDTQDLVQIFEKEFIPSQTSKITLPLVKTVIGRKDDYIIGFEGHKVPSINFYTFFRTFKNIIGFQIIQYSSREILCLIKNRHKLNHEELQKINHGLKIRIGNVPIYVKEVEKFQTNKDGKSLVILKKTGTYKIDFFKEYTLSTQKAWKELEDGLTNSKKMDWNEANVSPVFKKMRGLDLLFTTDHYLKWYPRTFHHSFLTKLQKYIGFNIHSSNISLTHGSDNALRLILHVFGEAGCKCLVLIPNYDNFRSQAQLFDISIETHEVLSNNEQNLQRIIHKIKESNFNIIYLSNPNNPVGYCFSDDQILQIVEVAKEKDCIVIVDEAYFEFSLKSCVNLLHSFNNLIIVRTFSKAFGLAGLRIGYIITSQEINVNIQKVSNPKDVTMFAVKAAEISLDNIDMVKDYVDNVNRNKKIFYSHCKKRKLAYYESEGNFVSFKIPNLNDYIKKMADNKIYVRDRSMYFKDSYVRVTIPGTSDFEEFIKLHDDIIK